MVDKSIYRRFQKGSWVLLILLLPFTSLPIIAKLTGMSMVAPPSIILLVLLGIFWWFPAIVRGRKLPFSVIPVIVFAILAVLSAVVALLLPIPSFRSSSFFGNSIEALITLGIGIAFFLLAATWIKEHSDLRWLLQWVNIAGCAILIWSLIQAYVWYTNNAYPEWAYSLQNLFSASGNLYQQRATGFAYEPSWLAHQLNMLFLPYWLAATTQRTSVHQLRLKGITLENLLLAGGCAVLFLSLSRVGWLAFLITVGFLLIVINAIFIKNTQRKILNHLTGQRIKKMARWFLPLVMVLLLAIGYIGLLLSAGFVLSKIDYRMANLFSPSILEQGGFSEIANKLVFAERVVFWNTGLEIFNQYPVFGVGPGNAGYFFPEKMVAFGWGLTETSTIMYQMDSIPNTKSLWVRILAENGLIGFSVFISWLYVLWINGIALMKTREPLPRTIGWMGAFVLIALIIEGFSLDTFALPYYWLSFGLLVATYQITAQRTNTA